MFRLTRLIEKYFFADANAGKLFSLNQQFDIIDSVNAGKGTVAMLNTNNGMQVLSMGILSPSDAKLGKLSLINKNKNNSTLLDSLQRPVFVSYADLDNDKKEDIVVNEFGFRQGSLNWYKNMGNGKYEKHLLRALPGAIRTEIFDFNKDGRPDIIALMAQGDEGVFIYYNEGNGKFREERVASFPPCMAPAIFSCSIITRMALWIFLQQTETMQTIPFH